MTPPRKRINLVTTPGPIYAVGDIHGCFGELLGAEARIRDDARTAGYRATIIYLGDFVDRGERSARVLEHLSRPPQDDLIRLAVCGNHDDAFLRFLRDGAGGEHWLHFGGVATLQSYGVNAQDVLKSIGGMEALVAAAREAVPQHHVDFLQDLPVALSIGKYLFVHAGIRPGQVLENQTDDDLMWIREPFLSEGPMLPLTVIHGHTIVPEPVFGTRRIGIDTACYSTGVLTVLKVTPKAAAVL
ncbi:metallophosphoesterase family protein (plasmid) [Rhizobium sp. 32-5/1]|uniref:metallophosphoesterase family protein n=1 Tax=Rhizobium sp. 32-5/1 TaxID=3019602 RepID=UPI00240D8D85|nr:metallophosphoesterase family protein [Rhizobium sp. 32-5/1]WEZ85299.1 metallophosphoesterase family protein [Rhizobium sp. 32-5/1]